MKPRISFSYRNTIGMMVFLFHYWAIPAQGGMTIYDANNSGLPDNAVNAVGVAADGKVWAGTDNGLASFDGSNWVVYNTANSGLPSNSVRSVSQDHSGAIWAGTFGSGVARYDGLAWTVWDPTNSSLPGEHVRSLAADLAGGMWIGTTSGLARLRGGVMDTWNFLAQGSESNNTAAIAVQDTEIVWLGMVNGGLIRVSDTGFADYTIHNSGLTDNTILGVALSTDDPWLATPANGVAYYWNLAWLSYHPLNSSNPSFSYTSITRDASGNIWLGSIDKGVVYYDLQNWRSFEMANSAIPQNQIRCITFDPIQNAIWVGTASAGLVKMEIDLVLGIQAWDTDESMRIYPQPCLGELVLEYEGSKRMEYRLSTMSGQLVANGNVAVGRNVLDLEGLAPGMYLLECVGAQRLVKKVLLR